MNREQAQQLITLLEQVRRRPAMYFPLDKSGLKGFQGGLYSLPLAFFGTDDYPALTAAVLQERGWDPNNAIAPWPEMEARKLTIHEMITEILTIEIEILRRTYGVE